MDIIIDLMILLVGYFLAIFVVFWKLVIDPKDTLQEITKIKSRRRLIIIAAIIGMAVGIYKVVSDSSEKQYDKKQIKTQNLKIDSLKSMVKSIDSSYRKINNNYNRDTSRFGDFKSKLERDFL